MSTVGGDVGGQLSPGDEQRGTAHERLRESREFRSLRRRMRGFTFPVCALFLLWYVAYVLLASYARDLMSTPVLGGITLGLLLGLAQFATTFALTAAYVAFARRRLDPLADELRARAEAAGAATDGLAPGDAPGHPVVPATRRGTDALGAVDVAVPALRPVGGAR